MIRFILRRLLLSIPVLAGVVVIVFLLARVIPADPCLAALGERATQAACDAFNQRFGLNEPLHEQFLIYISSLARGDFGESIRTGQPVTEILLQRLPTTVELTILALFFAITVGMTLGIVAAYRRNSAADVGTMIVANVGVSIPVFVLGLLLAFIFAILLRDSPFALPPSGRTSPGLSFQSIPQAWGLEDLGGIPRTALDFLSNMYLLNGLVTLQFDLFLDALRHLILPAIALGTIPMAIIARMTRSSLLDVLGQDYIRTARAKGLQNRLVVFRHGLKNALLPVVTVIGLSVGALLSGAVLTETIFGLTGVGRTVFESITARDYIVIQGFTLIIALIYVVVNLVVDISYGFLDPRIRVS
ncbi:MAG: ABC transporter permease [Chloroflexota bacterium]|nr:ABC transporter permease [Chloroflexota bacterium]